MRLNELDRHINATLRGHGGTYAEHLYARALRKMIDQLRSDSEKGVVVSDPTYCDSLLRRMARAAGDYWGIDE